MNVMKWNSSLCAVAAALTALSASADVTAWWRMNGTAGANATTVAPTIGTLSFTGAANGGSGITPVFQDDTWGDAYFLSREDGAVPQASTANGSVRVRKHPDNSNGGKFSVNDPNNLLVGVLDATNAASFTVEAILRIDSYAGQWTAVMSFGGASAPLLVELNGTGGGNLWQVCCDRYARNESVIPVTFNVMDGAWHHFAVTYDAATTNVTVYGDYKQITSKQAKYPMARTTSLSLGGNNFDGAFDEVRISEGVLSPNQFLTLSTAHPANFLYPMNTARSGVITPANAYAASTGVTLISDAAALTGCNTGIHSYMKDPDGPMRNEPYAVSFDAARSSAFSIDRFSAAALEHSPFTLEAYLCTTAAEGSIFKHGGLWSLGFADDALVFTVGETATALGASSALADGHWHHLAFVYGLDGETASCAVYVDGAAFGTISSTAPLSAGLVPLTLGEGFTGKMFAFKASEAARLPAQFLSFVEFPTDSAYAYWNFDSPDTAFEYFPGTVGELGAVSGLQSLGLTGGVKGGNDYYANNSTAAQNTNYRPYLTNDVPCAYTWDAASGRIINPENLTAVRFTTADTNNTACVNGSLVKAPNSGDCFPSNVTVELFVREYARQAFASMMNLGDNGSVAWMIDTMNTAPQPRVRMDFVGYANTTWGFGKGFDDYEWHHVALTIETTETGTKVNGYLDYTNRLSTAHNGVMRLASGNYCINFGGICGRSWDGMVDEPRITEGILAPEHFMRPFTPRADITGIWLADGVKGEELLSPDTAYLTASFDAAAVTASDDLPFAASTVTVGGRSRAVPQSARFSGGAGLVVPCAAVVGSRNFTVEATVRGKGTMAAKARAFGKSWAVGVSDDGFAQMRFDDVALGAAVIVTPNVTVSAATVDDGEWHHVAMAVDRDASQTATLYVDGVSVAAADVSGMKIDAGDFEIGCGWTGEMIAVRYSPGALAPADFLKVTPPTGTTVIIR